MPDVVNLPLTEGDVTPRTIQLYSADAAMDLSDATIVAYIKPDATTANGATGTHTLTVGSGLTVVTEATGIVRMAIPAAVAASPSWWWYTIKVTRAGFSETAVHGWIPVSDA